MRWSEVCIYMLGRKGRQGEKEGRKGKGVNLWLRTCEKKNRNKEKRVEEEREGRQVFESVKDEDSIGKGKREGKGREDKCIKVP